MCKAKIGFLLALLSAVSLAASETYEGYKVYRMYPTTEEQKSFLRSLEDSDELDFWAGVKGINAPVDIMVKPKDQQKFVTAMQGSGMEPEIFIDDVQEKIQPEHVGSLGAIADMSWDKYYILDDIYSWLDNLAAQYPKASIIIGGTTYEQRQIKGVKVYNGADKKTVFVEGGIHAREWISPATVNYLLYELLTSTDPDFRQIADSFNWHMFPTTNPDGYVFSHTTDRLWRKTRTEYPQGSWGADANRNWDCHWGEIDASERCQSEIYRGPVPFSEIETNSLHNYITNVSTELVSYISFHSYSQMLMVPYGFTKDHLDNYDEAVAVCQVAIAALEKRYGTKYLRCGNIAEVEHPTSGLSSDWVKQEFKPPLTYVYELRDTGKYGYLLPPNQILPNNLEVFDSIIAMFLEADRRGIVKLNRY